MSQYILAAGDTPATIAARFHLPWEVIWGHAANAALRNTRGGPQGAAAAGDTIFVPDAQVVTAAPGSTTVQDARDREYYINRSFVNAFGGGASADPAAFRRSQDASWNPAAGWRANRERIRSVYDYYRRVYLLRPDIFLWAGLGRLAGGAVFGGVEVLDSLSGDGGDAGRVKQIMVSIGKAIFMDLAWQHEAFLDDPQRAIDLATSYEAGRGLGGTSYSAAWRKLRAQDSIDASADVHPDDHAARDASPDDIAQANQAFLHNEQWRIIQPFYDRILHDSGMRRETANTSAITNNVHPYHRPFLERYPSGNILRAADRWSWITEPSGMWRAWVALPSRERARLVNLSLDDMHHQQWGEPIRTGPAVPPGAYTSNDA